MCTLLLEESPTVVLIVVVAVVVVVVAAAVPVAVVAGSARRGGSEEMVEEIEPMPVLLPLVFPMFPEQSEMMPDEDWISGRISGRISQGIRIGKCDNDNQDQNGKKSTQDYQLEVEHFSSFFSFCECFFGQIMSN